MQVTDAQVIEALRIYHRHEGGPTPSMKAAIDFLQIPAPTEEEFADILGDLGHSSTNIARYAILRFISHRNSPPPKVDPRREAIAKVLKSQPNVIVGEIADLILKALDEVKP